MIILRQSLVCSGSLLSMTGLRWSIVTTSLIGAAAVVVLILNPRWVTVESVEIELAAGSDQHLLFERIKHSLVPQFKPLEGKFFWQVPLGQVYEMAAKDKRVKRLNVHREFPSRLRVELEPRTPALAYLARDGRIYPVATDATLLPALSLKDSPDLPFLRGEELKDEPSLRARAIDLFEAMPDHGLLSKAQISEIVFNKKEGFKIFVSSSKLEVKMGDTDFGPKISRVQKVLSYLDAQSIKGRVIDARFSKKVVVRVRNTP